MTRKCQNNILQTNPRHREEKTKTNNNHMALSIPERKCLFCWISWMLCMFLMLCLYYLISAAYLASIEDSISLAMDTQINNIIVTGDFKFDMLSNHTSRKVSELCEQFSLYQTITEPTHFTENSSSLIEIILTSDKGNLIYSGVAEPFLHQDVRYHCPVHGVFKYTKTSRKSFTHTYGAMTEEITTYF